MTTIITKNSSTAGAAPLAADLVQGELAVNVTSKALYTKNASAAVVKLNTPSIVDNGDATAITIDSSENVGIGVVPSVTPTGYKYVSVGATGNGIYGYSSFGVQLTANAQLSGSTWQYAYGTGSNTAARIDMNDSAAGFKFFTAAAGTGGSTISWTQAMTLDSSGNLLVGATDISKTAGVGLKLNPNAGGTNSAQFSCVGSASTNSNESYHLYSTGAGAYRFYVGYGGTVYATSTSISAISDIRFKENVRDLDVGLAEVMALKPRLYDWKEGKGADIKNARGFIAQEFETVFPDLIDEWKDEAPEGEEPYKSVRQDLIPVLVKAIQEQQALINAQQAALTTLTERITALEAK